MCPSCLHFLKVSGKLQKSFYTVLKTSLALPAGIRKLTVRGHVTLLLAFEAGVGQLALVGLVALLLTLEAFVRDGTVLGEVAFLAAFPASSAIPTAVT